MVSERHNTGGNLTGIYLPDDLVQDTSSFETASPISNTQGLLLSAAEALSRGPVFGTVEASQGFLAKNFATGTLIPKADWEKGPYFREGLSFDALKTNENAVSEQVAKNAAARFDRESITEARLNNMRPGFLSGGAKFAGDLIGFSLDPLNIATFKGATMIVGKGNSLLLSKLGETKTARLGQAALGLGEGAAAVTPSVAASFVADDVYGEDPSVVEALATIGLGAGLGGLIRGAFGFKKPITNESYNQARETSINQMEAGKSVHVDEIVEQGYAEERFREKGEVSTKPNSVREEALQNSERVKRRIAELETELGTAEEEALFNAKIKGQIQSKGAVTKASDYIKKAVMLSNKPAADRNASDRLFLKNLSNNEEMRRAVKVAQKDASLRTPEEEQFLVEMLDGGEADLIRERIARHEEDIELVRRELEKPTTAAKTAGLLEKTIEDLNERILQGENRLFDLSGKTRPTKRIKQIKDEINRARKEGTELAGIIEDHQAEEIMEANPGSTVSEQQLRSSSKKVNSIDGEAVYDKQLNESFNREAESIGNNPELSGLADLERLVNDFDLTAEESLALEEIKEIDTKTSALKKAVDDAVECLIRNS